ncbi:MAG: MgtC/SapB family protein [Thermoanaerobaculia bacterium]|nr:MgtC/SapB family protein [Thermoanaerobaculia bacterium]
MGLDLDFDVILFHVGRLAIAFVLALPVAWDRERAERTLGLRTFPLVAMASAGYLLLARTVFDGAPEAQARFFQGLMTGIGFLGGGAIVKRGLNVHGTATAASIWNTAAMGAAVAYGLFEIALLLSLVNFAVLRFLGAVKKEVNGGDEAGDGGSGE